MFDACFADAETACQTRHCKFASKALCVATGYSLLGVLFCAAAYSIAAAINDTSSDALVHTNARPQEGTCSGACCVFNHGGRLFDLIAECNPQ